MTRDQAQRLIGTTVTAWTACNGEYIGILREVITGGKWRGIVEITGVIKPATHFEHGKCVRKGFRIAEMIEVGGISIQRARDDHRSVGKTYREMLEYQLKEFKHWLTKHTETPNEFRSRYSGFLVPMVEMYEKILAEGQVNGKPF